MNYLEKFKDIDTFIPNPIEDPALAVLFGVGELGGGGIYHAQGGSAEATIII